MKRPSFQFYPDDWTGNSKLRRCKASHKGAWIDTLCLLHGSEEYGIMRCPLQEISQAIGHPIKLLRELVERKILKGSDTAVEAFTYAPRHAGKLGATVTLIPAQPGPLWYASRMVRDEYRRSVSGGSTRFKADDEPSPSQRHGERQGDEPCQRPGHGAPTPSPTPSPKKVLKPCAVAPDWLPPEWADYEQHRREKRSKFTPTARAKCIEQLGQWRAKGHDIAAIIRHSIANGYTGLFEPKANGNSHSLNRQEELEKRNASVDWTPPETRNAGH